MPRPIRTLLTLLAAVGVVVTLAPTVSADTAAPSDTAAAMDHVMDVGGADDSGNQTMGGGAGTDPANPQLATRLAAPLNTSGGNMFDTCDAPSLEAMTAWLASPYRTVGIYIGGIARGCATQRHLTPGWIRATGEMGWNHVPIYVGLQAACWASSSKKKMSTDPATARAQGQAAALDAIVQMKALGISPARPIYLDIEHYSTRDAACVGGVKAFTNAWSTTLKRQGWVSGIYGSANSMITNLETWRHQPGYTDPDHIWIARWNGIPTTDEPVLPADAWAGRRIHQFTGGHKETWGGITINIDSNITSSSLLVAQRQRVIWNSGNVKIGTGGVSLRVTGRSGVPASATATALLIEVRNPSAAGGLIVTTDRTTSTIAQQHFAKGQSTTATVLVPVAARRVHISLSAGQAQLVVSAVGYLDSTRGELATAVPPAQVWDSRDAQVGQVPQPVQVAGVGGIPEDATAAFVTVTAVRPSANGKLVVSPHGTGASALASQYVRKGVNISTTALVPLVDGKIDVRVSSGTARIIVNAQGYLSDTGGGQFTSIKPTVGWDSAKVPARRVGTAAAQLRMTGIPSTATAALVSIEVINPTRSGNLVVQTYKGNQRVGAQQFSARQTTAITVLAPVKNRVMQLRLTHGSARVVITTLGYVTP